MFNLIIFLLFHLYSKIFKFSCSNKISDTSFWFRIIDYIYFIRKNKKFIFYKLFSFFNNYPNNEIISGAFSFPLQIYFFIFIFYCLIKIFISPFIILFTIFLLFHVENMNLEKSFIDENDSNSNLSIFYNTYNKYFQI